MSEDCCPHASGAFDEAKTRQLRFAVGLTSCVLVGELIGGFWTHSLALLSDAGHVFSDVFSLGLSLFAVGLACRPPTDRHTYGLHRAEVFAALINGLTLLVISGVIFREAWLRLASPPEIRSAQMLAIAVLGMVANGVVALRLGGHSHGDINLRSAYLHVVGDLLASVGVVIGAGVIWATGWKIVDPILSAAIGLLIVVGSVRVIAEASHILLEGVPPGIDLQEVAQALTDLPQVEAVHSVHAWSICSNVLAFSAHVVTCPETESERAEVRRTLDDILGRRFGFSHTTLELECEPCCDGKFLRQFAHGVNAAHNHVHE